MNRTSTIEKGKFGFKSVGSTQALTKIAILSVFAYVIMFIEMPLFFFPGFLKLDISDIPALIGGLALGPVAGIMIELIKNVLHLITKTTTGGVGELANFLIGIALVIPTSIMYNKHRSKKSAVVGMLIGTIMMTIVGGIFNYFILLPFYAKIMPLEQIIAWSSAANSAIVDLKTLVYYGIIPFNILKGIIVSIFTFLLYKKLSPVLKSK
ncbi:ECF transporter S component [Lutibacter sp. B2]|nr:ECF transporter S component [Lutibacter sp. B2]